VKKQRNNSMVHYGDYVAGWFDSSIQDFLEALPRTSTRMKYALITSLDSNPEPRSLLDKSPELRSVAEAATPLGGGILLPAAHLLETDSTKQIFYGFDEVWFFPSTDISPKPASASLVGPRRIDQARLDKLGPWMTENACSLGLGDGSGLNLIVKARGLIKYLIASSLAQPQPTLQAEELCEAETGQ
jgi:hypothetical protein